MHSDVDMRNNIILEFTQLPNDHLDSIHFRSSLKKKKKMWGSTKIPELATLTMTTGDVRTSAPEKITLFQCKQIASVPTQTLR